MPVPRELRSTGPQDRCKSARGPDADLRRNILIYFISEGSRFGADSHADRQQRGSTREASEATGGRGGENHPLVATRCVATIGRREPALTRTRLRTRRSLLGLGSPVPSPQPRSDEPRQRRADREACQHYGGKCLERVIGERGDHQYGNDPDAEGHGVRHHEHERSYLKACRHANPFRTEPRVYLETTVGGSGKFRGTENVPTPSGAGEQASCLMGRAHLCSKQLPAPRNIPNRHNASAFGLSERY